MPNNRPEAIWKYNPTAQTLGTTTPGGLTTSIMNVIAAGKFTATDYCSVTALKAYIEIIGSVGITIRGIIYDETYTKVAETAEITPLAAAATWLSMTFANQVLLDKGRTYWFSVWASGTGGTITVARAAGTAGNYASQAIVYSSTTPDPIVPDSLEAFTLSIYASLSKYSDLTNNSENINFIASSSDIFYIGFSRRYLGLMFDLSTLGSYTSITYEYLTTSTTWKRVQTIDSYTFSETKYQRWNLPNEWARLDFSSAFPQLVDPPDSVERYWIRIRAITVTTQAVISKIRVIPYAQYTTPAKISSLLSVKKPYDLTTKPSENDVEDMIRRAEDRIDYRTRKSWRFNAVTESTDPTMVDFNRAGMYLRHKNFYRVYAVKVWNGGSWDTLTEGRTGDYQVDYNLGMIYLTRTYILPAVYGIAGRNTSYNMGEYKNAIQVDYAYGRDPETDSEFYVAEDLATKMASVELLRHHDYSINTVSGSDKMSISEKIANLEEEIEMRLDELTGVAII